jgi:hypothetical protein
MTVPKLLPVLVLALAVAKNTGAFTIPSKSLRISHAGLGDLPSHTFGLSLRAESDSNTEGVVELLEEDAPTTLEQKSAAPFLSQGEISEDALNPDLSDPKQTRVIIYIILSLIPVLFLIPLMLGSRDLIPLDALPPVELS